MTIYNSLYAVVVFSLTFLSEAILQITIFKEPPTICYKNSSFIKKKKKKDSAPTMCQHSARQ